MQYGTTKIHFTSLKKALAASVDGSVSAGMQAGRGQRKTWITHVSKAAPCETTSEIIKRINKGL